MNKINKYIIAIFTIIFIISCENKDDFTGDSIVDFVPPTATFTIVGNNTDTTVMESNINPDADIQDITTGDYRYGVFLVEATIDNAVQFDTYIDMTQTGGTASSSDFSAERIKIPALQTKGYGKIIINRTGETEGDETLEISTNTNSPNVNGTETFSFNITDDYLNLDFLISVEWCGEFEYDVLGGGTLKSTYEDEIDIDLYIYGSDFASVDGANAATSSCPEVLNFSDLPNGTYYVLALVYSNTLPNLGINEDVPVKIYYEQEFFTPKTDVIHNFVLSTETIGDTNNNEPGGQPVLEVVKNGPQDYTVTAM